MTEFSQRMRQILVRARRDRKGAISIVTGLSLTAVLGFVGLGSEASYWYVTKRNMQGVTDSAAMTGATALLKSDNVDNAARAVAAQYGYVSGVNNVTVTVTNPYNNNNNLVEVTVSQPQKRLLTSLFMSSDPVISARSVALVSANCTGASCGCVLALDQSAVNDIKDSGGGTVNLKNCSLYVNSDSRINALWLTGSSQINAYSTFVDGTINGLSNLHDSNGTYQNTGTVSPDPYGAVQANTPINQCDYGTTYGGNGFKIDNSQNTYNLQPGVYCGGIKGTNASGNITVNLAPGTYYMKSGGFDLSGNFTFAGDGVTIVLTGDDVNGYATVSINGNVSGTLSAPTSGPLRGLTFFQDRNAPYSTQPQINKFNGSANLTINGAIYFPNQLVDYSGNSTTNPAQCTQLVAYAINFSGNTAFNASSCDDYGVAKIGVTSVALVE